MLDRMPPRPINAMEDRMSDFQDIAARLLKLASEKRATLATAESCTAGCLATLLADAPGGGTHFHGGFVVYSKEQKQAALGVDPALISSHSAVSQQVTEAMAKGVLEACPAHVAIAVTGVAGPEPDEDGNPVGLMHVAVSLRSGAMHHRRLQLGSDTKGTLRVMVMRSALELATEVLDAEKSSQPQS
ncbi:MAG: CinA family protein [Hyphomicrobiaceae bacterium]|nr:CinA family protein [Hyphomicrobiaceae bacterium]